MIPLFIEKFKPFFHFFKKFAKNSYLQKSNRNILCLLKEIGLLTTAISLGEKVNNEHCNEENRGNTSENDTVRSRKQIERRKIIYKIPAEHKKEKSAQYI